MHPDLEDYEPFVDELEEEEEPRSFLRRAPDVGSSDNFGRLVQEES